MIITLCVQFIVLQSGFSFSYHSIKRWKERYDTNVNCCKDIIFFNENTLLFPWLMFWFFMFIVSFLVHAFTAHYPFCYCPDIVI